MGSDFTHSGTEWGFHWVVVEVGVGGGDVTAQGRGDIKVAGELVGVGGARIMPPTASGNPALPHKWRRRRRHRRRAAC